MEKSKNKLRKVLILSFSLVTLAGIYGSVSKDSSDFTVNNYDTEYIDNNNNSENSNSQNSLDESAEIIESEVGVSEYQTNPDYFSLDSNSKSYIDLDNDILYVWGRNDRGQLGLGHTNQVTSPVEFSIPGVSSSEILELSISDDASYALLNDGTIYVWGSNFFGQLGLGDTDDRRAPTELVIEGVDDLSDISELYVSDKIDVHRSYIILSDGSTYVWGANSLGELGTGNRDDVLSPTKITIPGVSSADDISKVSVKQEEHSYIILSDGSIYVSGSNYYGQAGVESNEQFITSPTLLAIDGINSYEEIQEITFGTFSSIVLNDGSFYTWGFNNLGQLGTGDTLNKNKPTEIVISGVDSSIKVESLVMSQSSLSSTLLLSDGTIYAWGNNNSGHLGLGSVDKKLSPTELVIPGVDSIDDIQEYSFGSYSYLLLSDGTLYVWGYNTDGQLGTGDTEHVLIPTELEISDKGTDVKIEEAYIDYSSYAILSDGSIYVWGRNQRGQLGIGNREDALSPVELKIPEITSRSQIVEMSMYRSSYVILSDGTIYVWGENSYGSAGIGSNDHILSPTRFTIVDEYNIQLVRTEPSTAQLQGHFNSVGNSGIKYYSSNTAPSDPLALPSDAVEMIDETVELSSSTTYAYGKDVNDNVYYFESLTGIYSESSDYSINLVSSNSSLVSFTINNSNTDSKSKVKSINLNGKELVLDSDGTISVNSTNLGSWLLASDGVSYEISITNLSAVGISDILESSMISLLENMTVSYTVNELENTANASSLSVSSSIEKWEGNDYSVDLVKTSSTDIEFTINNSNTNSDSKIISFNLNGKEYILEENGDLTIWGVIVGSWVLEEDGVSYSIILTDLVTAEINDTSESNVLLLLQDISITYTIDESGTTESISNVETSSSIPKDSSGLSAGSIVGIVIGSLAGAALIAGGIVYFKKKKT